MQDIDEQHAALNAICPYFTMFPLEFPRRILARHAHAGQRVLDPFCGRGTTNFAARLAGLDTLGIDSNPVAVAITAAKLASSDVRSVVRSAQHILSNIREAPVPVGEFWERAYHPNVLRTLCRLRAGLLEDCRSNARLVLRGIILGALHGPLAIHAHSYFSNQSPRTYAPKPAYAVKYWRSRRMMPPKVNVLGIIRRRAERYLLAGLPDCAATTMLGDSRDGEVFAGAEEQLEFDWIITSPPYYGMRTYLQDQWLRNWFLGGSDTVDYSTNGQLEHMNPEFFSAQLSQVWSNVANSSTDDARLVIRFGGIRDRNVDPVDLIKASLRDAGWRVSTIHDAGSADSGKRQADFFLTTRSEPITECDIWASLS